MKSDVVEYAETVLGTRLLAYQKEMLRYVTDHKDISDLKIPRGRRHFDIFDVIAVFMIENELRGGKK